MVRLFYAIGLESKAFGCSYFSRIELHFVADGVIEAGERPTFTVEGPCNYSSNVNRDPERGNREVQITEAEMRQRISRLTSIEFKAN